MALQLRVSWLFMLMCACFLPQDGYRHVHGYYLIGGPLTSNQFNPGKFLEANFENNLEYLRQLYKNGNNARPTRSLMEEVQQGQPGSVHRRDKPLVFQKQMKTRGTSCQDKCPSTDLVYATKNLISARENQEFSPTPQNQAAPVRPDSNGKENGGLSRSNRETLHFSNKQFVQSDYKQPGHTLLTLDSSSGKDSFSGRRVSAPNAPKSLSQGGNHFSRKKIPSLPLNGNGNVLKSKYRSNRKYLSKRYKTPSAGFDKSLQRGIQTGFLPQKPQFLSSYVPRSLSTGKHLKKPVQLFQSFQSNASKRAKGAHHPPMLSQGVSSGFVVISNNRFPQSTRGHITVQYKPPKLQDDPHLVMKVPNSRHSSTTECKYLDYQKVDAMAPQKDIKLDLYNQNLVPDLQESNVSVTKPRETNLKQRVTPSNLSENQLKSFSAQDQFLLINGGYADALKAGLLKPFSQPDFPILSSMLNEDPAKLEPWPSLFLPDPQVSNCVVWKDTQRSPPQQAQRLSQSSENAYLASKNRSARATTSVSKICFTPNQWVKGKVAKLATRRRT